MKRFRGAVVELIIYIWLFGSYPANLAMMHYEVGWYCNDPAGISQYSPGTEYGGRTLSLVVSPFSVPLNGLYSVVKVCSNADWRNNAWRASPQASE